MTLRNRIYLALETSTNHCAAAILESERLILENSVHSPNKHNEILPTLVLGLVEKSSILLSDIETFIISIGPGSFTGLRVGLSFAKGLALACNGVLIPAQTLDAMAFTLNKQLFRLGEEEEMDYLMPLTIARKGEVFGKLYKLNNSNFPESESKIFSGDHKTICEQCKGKTFVGGPGLLTLNIDELTSKSEISVSDDIKPSAFDLGLLGISQSENTSMTSKDFATLEPDYHNEFTVKKKGG